MVLGVTVLAEVTGKALLNNGLTTQLRPRKYYTIPRDTLDALIGDVHELVNFVVMEVQRILFAENVPISAAVCILSRPFLLLTVSADTHSSGCHWFLCLVLPCQDRSLLGPCLDFHYGRFLCAPYLRD